eukprot:gene6508-7177_t
MSNASRPTYFPAVGRPDNNGIQTGYSSAKDQTAHTKMKFRQYGQGSQEELKDKREAFKEELAAKEKKFLLSKDITTAWMAKEVQKLNIPLLLQDQPDLEAVDQQYDDEDISFGHHGKEKKHQEEEGEGGGSGSDGFDSSSEEEDDDDEDDDEDELQAELERIRAERAQAQARKAAEEKALSEKLRHDEALKANPLASFTTTTATGGGSDGKIKRRWNDDVIFRNQAKDEPDVKKRFINDTVRSDFHRSFLKKFVK